MSTTAVVLTTVSIRHTIKFYAHDYGVKIFPSIDFGPCMTSKIADIVVNKYAIDSMNLIFATVISNADHEKIWWTKGPF